MSGLEVISGISSVIALLGVSIKIYDSAKSDTKLSETFEVVRRRLPVIIHILQRCKNELEPGKDSIPSDVCDALEKILDACDEKTRKLREIFEKVIPGEKDTWEKRYAKVIRRLGKGNKVEELMATLTQDVQLIVNNNAVKSATREQNVELEDILKEMKSIQSSAAEEEPPALAFHSDGGAQTNNINSGSGQQINNNAHVESQHIYSVTLRTGEDEDDEEAAWTSDISDESEDLYFPRVQCYHCKEYGHMIKSCPNKRECKRCGETGHDEEYCTKQNGRCYKCGRYGHYARTCYVPRSAWL